MISAASSGGGLPEHCVDFLPNGTSQPPSEEDLTTAFLQCMAQMITDHQDVEGELITRNSDAIRDLMVLFSAALVFFMQGKFEDDHRSMFLFLTRNPLCLLTYLILSIYFYSRICHALCRSRPQKEPSKYHAQKLAGCLRCQFGLLCGRLCLFLW